MALARVFMKDESRNEVVAIFRSCSGHRNSHEQQQNESSRQTEGGIETSLPCAGEGKPACLVCELVFHHGQHERKSVCSTDIPDGY